MSLTPTVDASGAGSQCAALRVLHLIDPLAPWAGPGTLRLLGDFGLNDDSHHHDVIIIGREAERELAAACGVYALGSIWPRGGRVLNAGGALRRWLAAARQADAAPDVIHAWSAGSGALSALAAPGVPRVVTPRPAAVDVDSPHLVQRQRIREHWLRHEHVAPDEFVIGLLGEHVERFDARQAMHVGARTGLSSRRIRLVMSGRSLGRPAAQRFLSAIDLDQSIIQDEGVAQPWRVLAGLDAVLLLGPVSNSRRSADDLSIQPLLWAWAAGVPVIAEASAPLHGLVQHDVNGLVFPAGDLNTGCDRVARLHDDRALAARLADTGRSIVRQRFAIDLFRQRVHRAYAQAIEHGCAAYLEVEHSISASA